MHYRRYPVIVTLAALLLAGCGGDDDGGSGGEGEGDAGGEQGYQAGSFSYQGSTDEDATLEEMRRPEDRGLVVFRISYTVPGEPGSDSVLSVDEIENVDVEVTGNLDQCGIQGDATSITESAPSVPVSGSDFEYSVGAVQFAGELNPAGDAPDVTWTIGDCEGQITHSSS
jgi:hypothetical protein